MGEKETEHWRRTNVGNMAREKGRGEKKLPSHYTVTFLTEAVNLGQIPIDTQSPHTYTTCLASSRLCLTGFNYSTQQGMSRSMVTDATTEFAIS